MGLDFCWRVCGLPGFVFLSVVVVCDLILGFLVALRGVCHFWFARCLRVGGLWVVLDCWFGSLDAGGCSFGCASVVRVVVCVSGRHLLGLAGMVGLISGWFDGCLWVGGWRLAAALVLVDCCERVLLRFGVWWFWLSGCWVVVVLVGLVRFWVSWWVCYDLWCDFAVAFSEYVCGWCGMCFLVTGGGFGVLEFGVVRCFWVWWWRGFLMRCDFGVF